MSWSGYVVKAVLLHLLRWMFLLFFFAPVGAVLLYRWLPVPLTPLMLIRCVEQVRAGEPVKLRHHWVSLDNMSEHLPVAVMASEDQRFLEHYGFDFEAIREAYEENLEGGRRRGGSTISQQTAKNVFLWPASSWLRKGLETYVTVLIELCWPKERIMEVYLNSIEMGHGIYGAEAVAQWHFGCTAAELTRAQCALIAATLPNPLRYDSARPSRYMMKRQKQIMREMEHIPPLPRNGGKPRKKSGWGQTNALPSKCRGSRLSAFRSR